MFRNYLLKTIVLSAFAFLSQIAFSQEKRVTGKGTDSKDGSGVPDVSVTVKGSTTGTTTSRDGTFAINVPPGATTLIFSSIGFAPQQVPINGRSSIDITLQATSGNLNEVVVIGYGTARKKDLTGSIATVTSKDFVKGP